MEHADKEVAFTAPSVHMLKDATPAKQPEPDQAEQQISPADKKLSSTAET